jgi:hypothetical protein
MHPALEAVLTKLYGYTTDEGGIRYALLDESNVGQADATYMLVVCSAFINYLVAKLAQMKNRTT